MYILHLYRFYKNDNNHNKKFCYRACNEHQMIDDVSSDGIPYDIQSLETVYFLHRMF